MSEELTIRGKVWRFGDDINTDLIYPSGKASTLDPREMASHAMEAENVDFAKKVQRGDIIVAGKNFGCGSSREKAPLALKYAGVGAIVADSFGRIFYRNALNIGLPVVQCEGIGGEVAQGDVLEVNVLKGEVANLSTNKKFKGTAIPEFLLRILLDGGLIPHLKKKRHGRE